jgi:peptidoglycan L-alanyl-D-glutamate endopeptidase CwlK
MQGMAAETRRSEDLTFLHPAIRDHVAEVIRELNGEGHPFQVFEAYRTPQRQAFLFAQGRTQPGDIVTKAQPWTSYHQYGLAVDIVLKIDGKWDWGTTGRKKAAWTRLHEVGRAHGLEPLSFEMPHLQMAGLKIADLRAGRYPAGGDESWADNFEAMIAAWRGSPAAPSVPPGSQRPAIAPGVAAPLAPMTETMMQTMPGMPASMEVDRPASGVAREARRSNNFAQVQPFIEKWEGGFVNHPRDKGGATNMGITLKTLAAWRQREVSEADVRALGREEARAIMKANYFDVVRGDDLPLPVCAVTYNAAILHGTNRAGKFLQTALQQCGASIGEDGIDGIVGRDTMNAVAQVAPQRLWQAFVAVQEAHFRAHPDFDVFGRGWLNRLSDLQSFVTRLPAEAPAIATGDTSMTQPIRPESFTLPGAQATLPEIIAKMEELMLLLGAQKPNAPIAAGSPVSAPVAGAQEPLARLGSIFALLQQLGGASTPIVQVPPKDTTKPLTPVNGALGSTVGRMLDGKKSAIGIIGSVLTGALGAILPAVGVAVPFMQPVMLGLAAWGLLGKLDKWRNAPKTV